jgi:predicted kinase
MEAVVFTGLQGSGKSTFYKERFFSTHMRINLDLLKTRHREKRLLELCLETQLPFVVDNTNPDRADRARYIAPSAEAGFRIVGYYFQSRVEACLRRNSDRVDRVPEAAILSTAKKLERPATVEGLDELWYVRIADGRFVVEEWNDEI